MKTYNQFLTLLTLLTYAAYGQLIPDSITNKVQEYHETNPQEKVYLDFDKTSYSSGDIIWFKTYLMAGFYNQLSPLSKIIYVELINPEGQLVERILVESDFGVGAGYFELEASMSTGKYLIRAYTKWMQNFDPEFFYRKEINIFSIFENGDSIPANTEIADFNTTFLPEGGNLVSGLQSNVAFQVVGDDGQGIEATGVVLDQNDDTVVNFETHFQGMGSFYFTPEPGKRYQSRVRSGDVVKEFDLPIIFTTGQTMNLVNIPNYDDIRFQVFNNDPYESEVILFIHSKGLPLVSINANFNEGPVTGVIPKKNVFQPGINHFTVISKSGKPLVERLFFYDTIPGFDLQLTTDKATYGKREKVELEIASEWLKKVKAPAFLSLAITNDNEVLIDPDEDNIITNMFLTSELKGHIQSPATYLDPVDKNRWKKQDLLMMVNGWRRFKWEDILESEPKELLFPIEQGLAIEGQLKTDLLRKGAAKGEVIYTILDSVNIFDETKADEDGYFSIPDLYFTGRKSFVLTGKDKKGKPSVTVTIDSALRAHPDLERPSSRLTGSLQDWQKEMIKNSMKREQVELSFDPKDAILLDAVEVTTEKITEQEKVQNIYGEGDFTLKAENITNASSLLHPLELVRGRVAGVRVIGSLNTWAVQIRGVASINAGTDPLILVDNLPVPLDFLNTIPASNIQSVEVYKGPSAVIFGSQGANGVLAFFTKPGYEPQDIYSTDNTTILNMQGYQDLREFYSPDYAVKQKEHVKPDERATLYWEPLLKLEDGKATIEFYTADSRSSYTIVLEGMTQTGQLGRAKANFNVR